MLAKNFTRIGGAILASTACLGFSGCVHEQQVVRSPDACEEAVQSIDDAVMRLPFEIVNGRVYVEARVNGRGPYRFAIDTGASGIGRADASLTAELALPISGDVVNSDGVRTAQAQTVHVESLEVGGLVRETFDVISRDYSSNLSDEAKISGIVARDFFADGLLVIDFPSRVATFSRARALTTEHAGVLVYERPFRVPVSVGSVNTTGNLDTGAAVTLVMPRSLYDQVATGALEQSGPGRLSNSTVATSRAMLDAEVRIGGVSASGIEVRVSEDYPELLVGGQLLQDSIVAIDQRSRLVAVCPVQHRDS